MQLIRRLVRSLGFEAGSAAERSPTIMAPTREEAGEKGRLMLLPRRHWLPSAGNNAVLFSPGSCSDQQNGLALLCALLGDNAQFCLTRAWAAAPPLPPPPPPPHLPCPLQPSHFTFPPSSFVPPRHHFCHLFLRSVGPD